MSDPTPPPRIRDESPDDRGPIHALHREAFAREAEADLVDRLRDGGFVRLSLVAERDGVLIGHLLLSELTLRASSHDVDALALAALAVRPDYQRQGIGGALVREALRLASNRPEAAVIVLGEPGYYGRFGFKTETAAILRCPFPDAEWAFQALELRPGALAEAAGAEVLYPPPFNDV